ncbi:MAG: hypothetical protein ACREPW_09665, partial [Candidatus Binataceae bacterium]
MGGVIQRVARVTGARIHKPPRRRGRGDSVAGRLFAGSTRAYLRSAAERQSAALAAPVAGASRRC